MCLLQWSALCVLWVCHSTLLTSIWTRASLEKRRKRVWGGKAPTQSFLLLFAQRHWDPQESENRRERSCVSDGTHCSRLASVSSAWCWISTGDSCIVSVVRLHWFFSFSHLLINFIYYICMYILYILLVNTTDPSLSIRKCFASIRSHVLPNRLVSLEVWVFIKLPKVTTKGKKSPPLLA